MTGSISHRRVEHGLLPEKSSTWRRMDLTLKERRQFYNASLAERIERFRREGETTFDLDQRERLTDCRRDIPDMAETATRFPALTDNSHASGIELNIGEVAVVPAPDVRNLKSLALRDRTQVAPAKTSVCPTREDNASDRGGLGTTNACVPSNHRETQVVCDTTGRLGPLASTQSAALSRDGYEASGAVCGTSTFGSVSRNSSSGSKPAMCCPFTIHPCLMANSMACTMLVMPEQRAQAVL